MPVSALGATYYVDAAAGNDGNDGLSASTAWKTLHKVSTSSLSAGDVVLFNRGQMWREQLTVRFSSTTFGAYGSGARPIFDGADLIKPGSSWTAHAPSSAPAEPNAPAAQAPTSQASKRAAPPRVWQTAVKVEPKAVFFDGVKGTNVASIGDCTGKGRWHWAGNVLYVYSAADPDTAYTKPGVEVAARPQAVWISKTVQSATLKGLHFKRGNDLNLGCVICFGRKTTIQDCEVSWGAKHGIAQAVHSGDNVFTANDIHDNGGSGILTWKDAGSPGHENYISHNEIYRNFQFGIHLTSNYYIIEHNHVHDNGNTSEMCVGIEIFNGDNDGYARHNIVRYNRSHGQKSGFNNGEGIDLDDFSAYNSVYCNISYGNDGPGITLWRSHDNTVFNNVCYGNCVNSGKALTTKTEMDITARRPGETANNVLKNNVAVATRPDTYAIYLDANTYNSPGLVISNNCWHAAGRNWYFWRTRGGNDLGKWNALTGVGTDLNAAPVFVNAAALDFRLRPESPALNTGDNSVWSGKADASDYAGTRITDAAGKIVAPGGTVDIGAHEHAAD